ncbi:restriction endonuclease subunit S [Fluviicola chungangensis]|uniref:Restriction endonuclease subunit S n=1 Tax=Fluviicola chungangensis TaxID=2597671 RepID=A0A556MYH3_9FLAO|nr:restriction endonuclease subunit S [Fluviicola chungangensis]TSJ44883.1 restriction endonuclease subunit S [Fluviicola chungangensis]
MNKTKTYKFNQLYEMNSGISSKPEQAGHGTPFLSFSTVFKNHFLPEELPDLMDISENEKIIYSIKEGDIFLTRTSETLDELGMSSVAVKDYSEASYSGFLKRLRPLQNDVTYHKFMAFYLRSKLFRKTMNNNAIMTLRASLNEQIFSYLDLVLPSFNEQKKIGDFLFLLNQKIELNNKINTELEAMAKLIYDYWFVQFDFPISKEQALAMGKPELEGKPYKTSGGKMVWNEVLKREIPEGWQVKSLGNYAFIKKGTLITEKTSNTNGNIKVVSAGLDFSYYHDTSNYPENTITISASGASAGFINFWREPIFACDCTTVRGRTDADTIHILGFLKLHQEFIFKQARGSAQPHVYPKDIEELCFPVPPETLIEKFGHFVIPGNSKISNNLKQNQELAALRDWLLPMLMNGQVTIADAESKEKEQTAKPKNNSYAKIQMLYTTIWANQEIEVKQGEMATAKDVYLLDRIYGVETGFQFKQHNWGSFDPEEKKLLNTKQYFHKVNFPNSKAVYVDLKDEGKLLDKIPTHLKETVSNAISEMNAKVFSRYFGTQKAEKKELFATVLKCIEDRQLLEPVVIRNEMANWKIKQGGKESSKADKFTEAETREALEMIIKENWHRNVMR